MEARESPLFVEFVDTHLVGAGFEAYLLQQKAILTVKEPSGHFQRLMKLGGRVLVIEYYLSEKLDTLYVLSGHVVKAGEKREKERKVIKEFISEIKELEEEE